MTLRRSSAARVCAGVRRPEMLLIELRNVVKAYPALRPLRVRGLSVAASDRLVLRGFDEGAAELFIYLVSGAALPDEGDVIIDGRNTRDIATDTEWLGSLDRFGIVTHRAVLLETMSAAANLALPLTLAIDPMAPETRARVEADARAASLPASMLDQPANALDAEGRLRLHLARAAATSPALVLLEHPTSTLTDRQLSTRAGETLKALAAARGFGWVALSEDEAFAAASGATVLALDGASGELASPKRGWRRWL